MHGPAYAPCESCAWCTPDPATDWGAYNKTRSSDRWLPLAQISTANVRDLRQVCTFQLDQPVNMQSALIEIGGTLYFTTLKDIRT